MTRLLRGAIPSLILAVGFVGAAVAGAAPPGPELSFNQFPGGITVNVTDKSGTTSWCRYSAEWFTPPPFLLFANKTYPLMIPFSSPDDKVWNVNVNCDNGASTHTTYNYVAPGTDPSVIESGPTDARQAECPPEQTSVNGVCQYPPCPYTGQYRDTADGQCKCGSGRSTNPDGSCGAYVGAPARPGLDGLAPSPRRSISFRRRRPRRRPAPRLLGIHVGPPDRRRVRSL